MEPVARAAPVVHVLQGKEDLTNPVESLCRRPDVAQKSHHKSHRKLSFFAVKVLCLKAAPRPRLD